MAKDRRRPLLNTQDFAAPKTSSATGVATPVKQPAPQRGGAPYVQAARQQMAQNRANLASGGGRRAAAGDFSPAGHEPGYRMPLSRDAVAGRPSANAVTSTPQGQTLIAGPNRGGYDPNQDARAAARTPAATVPAATHDAANIGPAGAVQAAMKPVEGGTGYQSIEAGTIGDPNKPGAHRVIITGPNKYETHMNVPWRDTEGVYGQKGAVYNVDSVIGHTGSPHSRPNFFPNPDYAAKVAGPPAAKPATGGFSMVGDVAGAPQVPERLAPQTQPERTGGVQVAMDGKPVASWGGDPVAQASGVDLSFSNLTGMKGPEMGPQTAQSPVDRLAAVFPPGGAPAMGASRPAVGPAGVPPPQWGIQFGGPSNQQQDAGGRAPAPAGPYPMVRLTRHRMLPVAQLQQACPISRPRTFRRLPTRTRLRKLKPRPKWTSTRPIRLRLRFWVEAHHAGESLTFHRHRRRHHQRNNHRGMRKSWRVHSMR